MSEKPPYEEFKEKNNVVRVTQTVDYIFPTYMGRTADLIREYFTEHSLNRGHASRDFHKHSEVFLSAEEIPWEQIEQELVLKKAAKESFE